jgi:hypothetical protein
MLTIRTLLNHRSGMRNYAYFTDRDKTVWDRKHINQPRYFDNYGDKNI